MGEWTLMTNPKNRTNEEKKRPVLTIQMKDENAYNKLRIKLMVGMWVLWNKKEISDSGFIRAFTKQFKNECMEAWRNDR